MDLKIIGFLFIFMRIAYFSSVKDIISQFEKIGQEAKKTSIRSKQKLFKNEIKINVKKFEEVPRPASILQINKDIKSKKEDVLNSGDKSTSELTESDAQFELYNIDNLKIRESQTDTSPESIISSKSWPAEKDSRSNLHTRFSEIIVLDMDEVNIFEELELEDRNLDLTTSSKSFDYKSFQNDTAYNLAEENNQELAENVLNLPNDYQDLSEIQDHLPENEALSMNKLDTNEESLLTINGKETALIKSGDNLNDFITPEFIDSKSNSSIQKPSTSKLTQDEQNQFIELERALDDLDKGVDLLLIAKKDAKLKNNNLSQVKEEDEILESEDKQISVIDYIDDEMDNSCKKTVLDKLSCQETPPLYDSFENKVNESKSINSNEDEIQGGEPYFNVVTNLKSTKKFSKKKRNKSSCFGRVFKKKKKYYDDDFS